MTPVKVRAPWPADMPARASTIAIGRVITERRYRELFSGNHEMRGRRAGIHDPDRILHALVRQSHRLRSGAGHGDGHVRASALLVRTRQVVPDRAERRL